MKKWFTYCLRLLVLLVLTCNMWGVLFARTETLTGPYSLSSNKTVASNDTLVINGNLTIQDNKTLTVKSNAVLLVKGNLTISSKGSLVLETPSTLLVTGNLTQKESLGFFVVYTGGVSANGALIVIEGNYVVETLLGLNESAAIDAGKNDVYVFGESTFSSNNYGDQDDLIKDKGVSSISAILPIELTSFTVSPTVNGYTFNWVTASEVENDYFTLEFSENGEEFIAIDYIHGAGTTSETSEYEYAWDAKPTADILYFRLKQTDYNGEFTYSDILVYAPKASHGATRTLYYGPLKLNVVDGQLRYIRNK